MVLLVPACCAYEPPHGKALFRSRTPLMWGHGYDGLVVAETVLVVEPVSPAASVTVIVLPEPLIDRLWADCAPWVKDRYVGLLPDVGTRVRPRIASVLSGSPAATAGLKPGDIVLSNGSGRLIAHRIESISGVSTDTATFILRGEELKCCLRLTPEIRLAQASDSKAGYPEFEQSNPPHRLVNRTRAGFQLKQG